MKSVKKGGSLQNSDKNFNQIFVQNQIQIVLTR